MSKLKLGWVGLGNMGTPMVKNLLKAGFEVQVFNRTRNKEQEVIQAGAKAATEIPALAAESDVILVMVSDDAAAKETFTGSGGLLSGNVEGKIFINISTVASATSKELDEACRAKGAEFLEVPVSGSVKPAEEATLIMLAGGEEEILQKVQPVLQAMGKQVLHLGPVGAGSAAKLAINYMIAVTVQGLAETILFANKSGISAEVMLQIIDGGAVASGVTKAKSPSLLKNDFPAAFALKHLTKDIRLAKEQGLNAPLSEPLYQTFTGANDVGLGNEDMMAVIKYLNK